MEHESVEVKANDLSVASDDSSVVVTGKAAKDLMTALVRRHQQGLEKLNSEAPSLTVDEIQMDPDGNVVISNAEFARAMRGRIRSMSEAQTLVDNIVCNILC